MLLGVAAVVGLLLAFAAQPAEANGPPTSGSQAKSLGKVTLDTDVSEWEVGSGQFNGEFVVAEGHGIELGLRAKERFLGPIDVSGDNGNRVGVYEASTVPGEPGDTGPWNYDWHVDLSGATGNAAGRTLDDYTLTLEYDFADDIFGLGNPAVLPMGDENLAEGVCSGDTFSETLCQQSWNPGFGNDQYDPSEPGTYTLRLVLTPETFNGQPLAVEIRVNVTD